MWQSRVKYLNTTWNALLGSLFLVSATLLGWAFWQEFDPLAQQIPTVEKPLIDRSEFTGSPCAELLEPTSVELPRFVIAGRHIPVRMTFGNSGTQACFVSLELPTTFFPNSQQPIDLDLMAGKKHVVRRQLFCAISGPCRPLVRLVSKKPEFEQTFQLFLFARPTIWQFLTDQIIQIVGICVSLGFFLQRFRGESISSRRKHTARVFRIRRSWAVTFVGRKEELIQLDQAVRAKDIVVVHGPSGIGKTELALRWIEERGRKRFDEGVWIDCTQSPGRQLIEFALHNLGFESHELGFDERSKGVEFERRVRDYIGPQIYREWNPARALIVFDNFLMDRIDELPLPPRELASRFRILILAHRAYQPAENVLVSLPDIPDAVELLTTNTRSQIDLGEATKLVVALGCLPLAVELVGRYMRMSEMTAARVLELIAANPINPAPLRATAEMTASHSSLFAAFDMAWEELPPEAQKAGLACGLLASAPIPRQWFISADKDGELEQGVVQLMRYGFCARAVDENGIELLSIHIWTHKFLRHKASQNSTLEVALRESLMNGMWAHREAAPFPPTAQWVQSRAVWIPHMLEICLIPDNGNLSKWLSLFRDLPAFLAYFHDYDTLDDIILRAVASLRASPDTTPEILSVLLHDHGRYLMQVRRNMAARRAYEEALQLYRLLASESMSVYELEVALILNNLGTLYRNENELELAREAYEESLGIYRRHQSAAVRSCELDVAGVLTNLGTLYSSENDFTAARQAYEEALAIFRHLVSENPQAYEPDMAGALNNLGTLYRSENDLVAARDAHEEAFEIYLRLASHNPRAYEPSVAGTLNNLGIVADVENDYVLARKTYEQALEIFRRLASLNLRAYEPYLAMTLNNLGTALRSENDLRSAHEKFSEAFEIFRRLASESPRMYEPDLARTLVNLGDLCAINNDRAVARDMYEQALGIFRRLASRSSKAYKPEVAATLSNLGILFRKDGDRVSAREAYEKALDVCRELVAENPRAGEAALATTLHNLGTIHHDDGESELAFEAYKEAIEIRRRLAFEAPRAYEPDMALTLANLCLLAIEHGNFSKYQAMAREARAILHRYPEIFPDEAHLRSAVELIFQLKKDVLNLMD